MKDEDTQQGCTNGSYPGPHHIRSPDGQMMSGFCQKRHTEYGHNYETRNPKGVFPTLFHLGNAETKSEAALAQSGNNQN